METDMFYRWQCPHCESVHYEHVKKKRIPFARFIAKHKTRCGKTGPFDPQPSDELVDTVLGEITTHTSLPSQLVRLPRVIHRADVAPLARAVYGMLT